MIETGRFKEWAVLELFGHRKIAGLVTEVELAGAILLRVEVPSDPPAQQIVGGKSLYALTLETEERCRAYAAGHRPEVLASYELRAPALPAATDAEEVDGEDDDGECESCGKPTAEADGTYDDLGTFICNHCWDGQPDDQRDCGGDDEPALCDLCECVVHPGEELRTIALEGVDYDVCGACAVAAPDPALATVHVRVTSEPVAVDRAAFQANLGVLADTAREVIDLGVNPTREQVRAAGFDDDSPEYRAALAAFESAAPTTDPAMCPFCKTRPLRVQAGFIETTCGEQACRDAEPF